MLTLLNNTNKGLYFIAGEESGLRRATKDELAQLSAAQQAAIAEREAINRAIGESVRLSALSGQRVAEPAPRDDIPRVPEYIELEGGRWVFNVRTHQFNEGAKCIEALPYSSLMEIISIKETMSVEVARLDNQAREAALNSELIDKANQQRLYALEERIAELEARVEELEGPHGWQVETGPPVDKAPEGPPIDNSGDRDGKPPIEWEVEHGKPSEGQDGGSSATASESEEEGR